MTPSPQPTPLAVTENQMAAAINMSVAFLRKDRRTKRLIPFYKIGDSVRYDLARVREVLIKREEGGANIKPRTRATRTAA